MRTSYSVLWVLLCLAMPSEFPDVPSQRAGRLGLSRGLSGSWWLSAVPHVPWLAAASLVSAPSPHRLLPCIFSLTGTPAPGVGAHLADPG